MSSWRTVRVAAVVVSPVVVAGSGRGALYTSSLVEVAAGASLRCVHC